MTVRCALPMVERRRSDISDNVSWWCPHCKGRKSIRDGSFFAKSRLTLQKWLVLMHFWAREYPVGDAAEVPGLLPIIRAHTAPHITVHSDEWAAYCRIQRIPTLNHEVVNHSLNFVDPTTGVHTQHIESYWNRVKGKLKRMRGCHADQLPSYLDEFMWRERHGRSAGVAFHQIANAGHCHSVSCVAIKT